MTSRLHREDGSAAFPTLVGVLLLLVGLAVVVYMARVPNVQGELQLAAAAGARAGTQQSMQSAAHSIATSTARNQLIEANVPCVDYQADISPPPVADELDPGSTVSVTLRCTVHVGDLTWVPLPTTTTLTASFSAPVDSYRGFSLDD